MDKKIIGEMLHDPNFDPISFMEDAFVDFIISNWNKFIYNEHIMKYIIKASESRDIYHISMHVAQTNTVGLPQISLHCDIMMSLLKRLDCIKNDKNQSYITNSICEIYNFLSAKSFDLSKANDTISTLPICPKNFSIDNIKNYSQDNIIKIFENWGISTAQYNLIDFFDNLQPDKYKLLLTTQFAKNLNNLGPKDFYPKMAQSLLFKIASQIPKEDLQQWYKFYNELKLDRIYSINYDAKTENICRCGHIAKTSYGLTNHIRSCDNKNPTVSLITKLRMARAGLFGYACHNCGKICNHKFGLTNHQKTCNNFIEIK